MTLLFVEEQPASAATPTYVQSTSSTAHSGTTMTKAYTGATTATNTLVVSYIVQPATTATCSDSAGNTFQTAVTFTTASTRTGICYASNIIGGSDTVTITAGATITNSRLSIQEYSNLGALDVTASQSAGSGTTATDGASSTSATTTVANDLVFGFTWDVSSSTTISAGTGFTIRQSMSSDYADESKVQASAGSTAATFTYALAHGYYAAMAAFKPANSSPNSPTSLAQYRSDGTTSIATGGVTEESSVVISATVADPDTSDTVSLCVEIQPTTTNFTNINTNCGTAVAQGGTATVTAPITADGTTYHWQVRGKDASGAYSSWVQFNTGYIAFTTPVSYGIPASVTIDPEFTLTISNRATACNGESNFVAGAGTSTAIALGHVAGGGNVSGGQTLSVNANSANGFRVYIRGTAGSGNLAKSGHSWTDVTGTYSSPAALGVGERFGYTWNDSTASSSTSNPAAALFAKLDNATTNQVMGSGTSQAGTACVSFDVQAGTTTPAGSYAATVVYTAVPSF